MANVPNLVYNSPYTSSSGGTLSIPNAGARIRNLLMNPFYATPALFIRGISRPTSGQIWPRGIGIVIVNNPIVIGGEPPPTPLPGPMSSPTGVQVYRSADLTISDNTLTVVPFNSIAIEDESTYWDVANPTKIVAPQSKWYIIVGQGKIDASAGAGSGIFNVIIRKNGTDQFAQQDIQLTPSIYTITLSTLLYLQASDYVELLVKAVLNGVNLTIKGGATATYLQLVKLT